MYLKIFIHIMGSPSRCSPSSGMPPAITLSYLLFIVKLPTLHGTLSLSSPSWTRRYIKPWVHQTVGCKIKLVPSSWLHRQVWKLFYLPKPACFRQRSEDRSNYRWRWGRQRETGTHCGKACARSRPLCWLGRCRRDEGTSLCERRLPRAGFVAGGLPKRCRRGDGLRHAGSFLPRRRSRGIGNKWSYWLALFLGR
jgi:hypothetical protein